MCICIIKIYYKKLELKRMPITIVVIDIRSRTIFFVLPYTTTGSMIFLIEN